MAKQLLIVDDEAPTRELLAMYFQKKGFATATVRSGQAALDYLNHHQPDLVILDVGLEDTDGIELLVPIKNKFANLPVVIFTGLKADEAMLERARKNGADAFLSKTQPMDTMLTAINRLLKL